MWSMTRVRSAMRRRLGERPRRAQPGPTLVLGAYGVLGDMRRQARRLWLGDWQRDDEPGAEGADTFVVTPDDGDHAEPAAEPRRRGRRAAAVAGVLALAFIVGFAISSGGDNKLTAVQPQTPPAQLP